GRLGPGRLVGGEAGISFARVGARSARLTWLDAGGSGRVRNGKLSATTAQRQSLGQTHVRGLQTDVEYRIGSFWRVSGAYVYDQAKVTDGGVANAALVGKYVPQVPLHHATFQVAYSNSKYANVALSVQTMSLQYNDDQNINFIP